MDEHASALRQARDAYAEGDWPTAAARFDVVPDENLTPYDLAAYFEAVWWLGGTEDALPIASSAYDALVADSRPYEAVKTRTASALGSAGESAS